MTARALVLSVEDRRKLVEAAFDAMKGAYCRYSGMSVGAAILTPDGQIIKGANIENASYGGTICAERTAIVKAVSEGIRSFTALAVVTNIPVPISPCGMCRQVLREFCSNDMPVLLVPGDYPQSTLPEDDPSKPGVFTEGGIRDTTVGILLPDSFGPGELKLPRM
ncbi:hypothetical protein AX15_005354 [Amanita polypyramis BW_CC]|nr:hypothetical protein AX15_005354 [Amanita polypyramis BW_CC]